MIINFIHIPKNGGTSIKNICIKNKNLQYNGHYTNVYNKHLLNQLVVIRNPIDRFISAINYSLQKYYYEPSIRYLLKNNINTPEKFIRILMNPSHIEHNNVLRVIKNNIHVIGNKKLKLKWTYSPQYLWINNPKFVIIMDNFNDELMYFIKKYNLQGSVIQKNKTYTSNNVISDECKNFIIKLYKKDYEIYNTYKNINYIKRL